MLVKMFMESFKFYKKKGGDFSKVINVDQCNEHVSNEN